MAKSFLNGSELPFCKGCGHSHVAKSTEKALQILGLDPLDVVLVTDIGCHGIIDKSFLTHTVHGLHGRSVAVGAGIAAGLSDASKKVIVYVGDGGATIGMQHLINAAHHGFDMTVVIHNNFLYGMTGGQPSEFTPQGFKTPTLTNGATIEGYDVCELLTAAGATYVRRVVGIGDFSEELAEAFSHRGFSIVEVMELCPSYAVKANPGLKLPAVLEAAGLHVKTFAKKEGRVFRSPVNDSRESLITSSLLVEARFPAQVAKPMGIMLAGSAGEGVQSAAELLGKAAVISGLHATKKGSYPVTVGVGFSASEVILSPWPIRYTGLPMPDILLVTSEDGLDYARSRMMRMDESTIVVLDETLEIPHIAAQVRRVDLRKLAGAKNAALSGVFRCVQDMNIIPIEALIAAFQETPLSEKIDITRFIGAGLER